MYQFPYTEAMDDISNEARMIERRMLEHSMKLLETAEAKGVYTPEATDALLFVRQLWGALIEDLAKPGKDLPQALKADLSSIGLWIFREAEQIRLEKSSNFRGIIEVTRVIWKGLQ